MEVIVWDRDLERAVEWMLAGWHSFGVTDGELIAKAGEFVGTAEAMLREALSEEGLADEYSGFDVARVAVALALESLAGERFVLDWLPGDTIDEIVREHRRGVAR